MAGGLTRRDLLKAGAIITAVAGCSGEESQSQTPPPDQPVPPVTGNLTADVVVVGAGFAGLGAAWELFKRGQRVIVLEANARIGGRIWSAQLSDGSLFEIGGQWVSDAQTDIRTLMNELGVGDRIYPTSDAGLTVFVGSDGKIAHFNQHDPDPLQALPPLDPVAQLEVAATFAYFEFNWSIEEFARGDFAAAPGPGVYTGVGVGPAIRAPFGRVHWAGVDTSTGPNYSSFSSAVQSGKRAAAEVLAAG